MLSNASDSQLSKIEIENGGLQIGAGNKVTIIADFYIAGTGSLQNLLLIDLECCSCLDPTVGNNYGAENQCPGIRLMMSGDNDYLSIERGNISGKTLQQTERTIPRNEWVSAQWVTILSNSNTAKNMLPINDVEVLNENAMNLPNTKIFKVEFAAEGIDFELQEPVFYERVQIGATANPTAGTVELFIDNFSIKVE